MHTSARRHYILISTVAAIAFSLTASQGWAGATDDAEDIRDKPIDKAQSKLSNRGYAIVESNAQKQYQYWWNRGKDQCLEVHVKNGKVSHAEAADEKKCREAGKRTQSSADAAPAGHASSSIVGMRASYLDGEMAARGFTNKGGYKDQDTSYTTWWNKSTRECVSVATREGRVDNMRSVSEGSCK